MKSYPGKLRGLQQCSSPEGVFTILALDHSPAYFARGNAKYHEIVEIKGELISGLGDLATAILLDPAHGLTAAVFGRRMPGSTGLVLAAEDGSYEEPAENKGAKILDGWSVAKIKSAGAEAVKIFFYYNPDHEGQAAIAETFVRDVAAECRSYDLPLFAEPLSYATSPEDRPRVVVETARRISALDIDVLKVEFPVDANVNRNEESWREACYDLNQACRTPWALLSAGVNFDTFSRQVEIACRSGASGFLAGRAIWGEVKNLKIDEIQTFMKKVARPRLQELSAIAAKTGRPWQDNYEEQLSIPPEGWYARYEGKT